MLLCPLFPTSRLPFSRRRHTRCFSVSSQVTDSSTLEPLPFSLTFTFTTLLNIIPRPPPALRSHTNPAFSSNPRLSALQIPEAHVLDPPASSAGNGAAAAAKGGSDEDVLVAWVEAVTGTTVEGGIEAGLRDGVVLCELLNCYETGLVRRVNRSRMPFKQRENISFFLSACSKRLGIMSGDLFTTSDLYEAKNIPQVQRGIRAAAQALQRVYANSGLPSPAAATGSGAPRNKHWRRLSMAMYGDGGGFSAGGAGAASNGMAYFKSTAGGGAAAGGGRAGKRRAGSSAARRKGTGGASTMMQGV